MGRAPGYIFDGNPYSIDWSVTNHASGQVHFAADVRYVGPLTIYRSSVAGGATPVITAKVLRQIAATYNEQRETAPVPLVLGIPKIDDPAYGWVARLEAQGDTLTADFGSVWPEVAKALKSGQRGTIDVDFFPPGAPGNPVSAQWSLRRVTVFGLDDLKLPPLPKPVVTPQGGPSPSVSTETPLPPRRPPVTPPKSVKDAIPGNVFDGMNLPRGFDADPEQAELYARILRIQREKTVTFAEAVTLAAADKALGNCSISLK